ncbi:hypothetical protein BC827DRAFT_355785 [Russula dissimulans]|nr:hypothetical protein BC827DRAFT_355785 [Russula dissimulans]
MGIVTSRSTWWILGPPKRKTDSYTSGNDENSTSSLSGPNSLRSFISYILIFYPPCLLRSNSTLMPLRRHYSKGRRLPSESSKLRRATALPVAGSLSSPVSTNEESMDSECVLWD